MLYVLTTNEVASGRLSCRAWTCHLESRAGALGTRYRPVSVRMDAG